jgi:hypothetical protein
LGVKQTSPFAAHMSANDPKRTLRGSGTYFIKSLVRLRSEGAMCTPFAGFKSIGFYEP